MKYCVASLAAAVLCFATTGRVQADLLFAVDSSSDSLYTVDSSTGAVTVIGRLHPDPTRFTTPVAMAIRLSDGAIFINNNSPISDAGLSIVDPATGLATHIGGGPFDQALAFSPSGVLYAQVGSLATVNPATGASVSLGGPILPRIFGMDFNAADGLLYGLTANAAGLTALLRINPSTGALVSTTPLSPSVGIPGSILFLPDGTLIGSSSNQLFDIDPATGAVSNFRSLPLGFSPQGLGVAVAVPEPSTLGLLSTGVLLLAGYARRRKRGAECGTS